MAQGRVPGLIVLVTFLTNEDTRSFRTWSGRSVLAAGGV